MKALPGLGTNGNATEKGKMWFESKRQTVRYGARVTIAVREELEKVCSMTKVRRT